MNHHPTLHATRFGCWADCACGWRSRAYTTAGGAHLAFGQHLLDAGQVEGCRYEVTSGEPDGGEPS